MRPGSWPEYIDSILITGQTGSICHDVTNVATIHNNSATRMNTTADTLTCRVCHTSNTAIPTTITGSDAACHPGVDHEAKHTSMRYWSNASLEPNTIFRTSSVEAVRSMVAVGMGIAILSDLIYRPWSLEGQRIDTRVIEDEVPSMDIGLAWRRDTRQSDAATAFRDFMRFAVAGVGPARPPVGMDHRHQAEEAIEI